MTSRLAMSNAVTETTVEPLVGDYDVGTVQPVNLAVHWLEGICDPEEASLSAWEGSCLELANCVRLWLDTKDHLTDIIYFESNKTGDPWHGILIPQRPEELPWRYHACVLVDGLVHDAWFPDLVMSPEAYVADAFPEQEVVWEVF